MRVVDTCRICSHQIKVYTETNTSHQKSQILNTPGSKSFISVRWKEKIRNTRINFCPNLDVVLFHNIMDAGDAENLVSNNGTLIFEVNGQKFEFIAEEDNLESESLVSATNTEEQEYTIIVTQDDDDTLYQDGSRIILKIKIRVSSLRLGVYSSTK